MTGRPQREAAFKRIIVIVTRQIGDVLLTTPLIGEAKRRWPTASIDVLGFAGTLGMLRGNPAVSTLIEVDPQSSWWRSLPLILRLWRRYDLGLIAQHTDRAHLYGWMAARTRSGQVPANTHSWWKRSLLVHSVELGSSHSHVVIEKMKLLAPWVPALARATVHPPPAEELPADLQVQLTAPYVVIQVASLVHYKQWPPGLYAELAAELVDRGMQVVLSGGPSAADRALVDEVLLACRQKVVDAAGRLNLNQMSRLLEGACLYIGPDTSITHLAAACGTPVVALFGPTNPLLWGPWPNGWALEPPFEKTGRLQQRGNVVLLQGTQTCVPCSREGCDRHRGSRSECLETMSPQRVLAEALSIVEGESGVKPLR